MFHLTSCLSPQSFKDISKDTFTKYKKVRTLHTPLMGQHSLYSKDGIKYLIKQLPSSQQFLTTRPCTSLYIHKYTAPNSSTTYYIYPLIGIGLQKVIEYSNTLKHGGKGLVGSGQNQTDAAKEYSNLLSRHCNSLEKVLGYVLRFLMNMTLVARQEEHLISEINNQKLSNPYNTPTSSTKHIHPTTTTKPSKPSSSSSPPNLPPINIPILLQCIYVHNGQLYYCYDTWMNSETQMVVDDIRQIENLFLQNKQLKEIEEVYAREMRLKMEREKQLKHGQQQQGDLNFKNQSSQVKSKPKPSPPNQIPQKTLTLFSSLYKSFLLTLYIGTMQLNLRIYQWGQFSLSYENLSKRLHHFKLKHNAHNSSKDKLANLLQKVLLSQRPGFQEEVRLNEILSVLKDSMTDLTSSVCKSQVQSSTIKAPKRVTLAKKTKISNFDHIQLSESAINNQRSSVAQTLQYASMTHQQHPFTQTTDFIQNYQSCQHQNSTSKNSATKNRTLSNMVLKECNSLQKLQRNDILIIDEKQMFGQSNNMKKNSKSNKKQPLTSTKKNKQNMKTSSAFYSNSQQKNKPPLNNATIKTIKKVLFTPKVIHKIIQAFQNLSELSVSSCCSLVKLLGLEYWETRSSLEELVLDKLSHLIVNQNWVSKQYGDNSFYFGEVVDSKTQTEKKELQKKIPKHNQSDSLKRHGVGVYIFPSKDLYFGNWVNNLMQGHGTYLFQSGEVYSGELSQGHKQGFGTFWYSDGKKYEGFWKNDHKVGLGTVYFTLENSLSSENSQVVKFLGQFKQGKNDHQVQGIFTGYGHSDKIWSKQGNLNQFDPTTFQFKQKNKKNRFDNIQNPTKTQKLMNCSLSKYREFIDSFGKKYTGQVQDDRKNGYGIQETQDYHFEGNFVNDERSGKGKLVTRQNMTIEGVWQDGMMVEYILG